MLNLLLGEGAGGALRAVETQAVAAPSALAKTLKLPFIKHVRTAVGPYISAVQSGTMNAWRAFTASLPVRLVTQTAGKLFLSFSRTRVGSVVVANANKAYTAVRRLLPQPSVWLQRSPAIKQRLMQQGMVRLG